MARSVYHHASMNSNYTARSAEAAPVQESLLWKCVILAALSYLIWSDKLAIVLDFSAIPKEAQGTVQLEGQRMPASILAKPMPPPRPLKSEIYTKLVLPSGSQGHPTLIIDPGFAKRNGIDPVTVSVSAAQCKDYVARFAPVAIAEMHRFGIPASITLAQGLLESNSGDSKLAVNSNNHFGLKCFSNRCKRGHCINVEDDSHKDFFVRYSNVWSSYRDHSKLLKNSRRYAHLFKLDPTDFRAWAKGLAKAGYATDKKYAEKLIALIINLQLYNYDKQ